MLNAQDVSRVCLARALAHFELAADACLSDALDRSSYGGHLYSDKAPGMSALEVPVVAALHIPVAREWPYPIYRSLWPTRVLTAGLAFLGCAFLVGRLSEGIAPGFGGLTLVTFAIGTLVAPLAAANFDHVPAAALGFLAFTLAWKRRPHLAGLAAGAALFVEYQSTVLIVIVGIYVALQGRWAVLNYARGVLPGAALLWTYNWMAFGAPWRPSYKFVANEYAGDQSHGVFGVSLPRAHSVYDVMIGNKGILVVSPVTLAAAAGLVLLSRRYRAEALTCGAVVAAYLVVSCGYFLPYGGVSPGPRFVVPALPFLALGLPLAFARLPRTTALLAAVSVLAMTAVTLTWTQATLYRHTVWGEIARLAVDGRSSRLVQSLSSNALGWLGAGPDLSALVVTGCAAGALALALRSTPRRSLKE